MRYGGKPALVGGQVEELEVRKARFMPLARAKLAVATGSVADIERQGFDERASDVALPRIASFSAPSMNLYQDHPAIAQGPLP